MRGDIIIPLTKWRTDGYKLLDWLVANVGQKGVAWESGIEITYVPTLGECKYAMIRIHDEQYDLMFRMLFPQYISSRHLETCARKPTHWTTLYEE